MKPSLPIVCLLCLSQNVLGHWIEQEWIHFDDEIAEISYQDIININGSCFPRDSCMQHRTDDSIVPSWNYSCSCDTRCWEFGTCCIDSPYRVKSPIQTCRNNGDSFFGSAYYMVYRCPDYTYSDSIWKNLCEKEWSGEDDLLMLSPVSSLETSRTYKNFYCFKCHETTEKYISWNLHLKSGFDISDKKSDYSVTYNQAENTWMATWDDNPFSIPVDVIFEFPYSEGFYPLGCYLRLISNCSDTWTDKSMRDKCLAYTAVIHRTFDRYKNVHCAICNYVSLDSLTCRPLDESGFAVVVGEKGIFSFRDLLNINESTRDKVGDSGKCKNGHLWDPYAKKCRKQTCAIPTYVIQGNRCVPP